MTNDIAALTELAHRIAAAIAGRDVASLRALLAPGFVHRGHEGAASDADAFLEGVGRIPGEIQFVRLETLVVDRAPGCAMATGAQHARVAVDGQIVDDRRGFVDVFVPLEDGWRLQAAFDFPLGDR